MECHKLAYIEIPAGCTELRQLALAKCHKLAYIEIPYGRVIGENAFFHCLELERLSSLAGLSIEEWGRNNWRNEEGRRTERKLVTAIVFPDSLQHIDEWGRNNWRKAHPEIAMQQQPQFGQALPPQYYEQQQQQQFVQQQMPQQMNNMGGMGQQQQQFDQQQPQFGQAPPPQYYEQQQQQQQQQQFVQNTTNNAMNNAMNSAFASMSQQGGQNSNPTTAQHVFINGATDEATVQAIFNAAMQGGGQNPDMMEMVNNLVNKKMQQQQPQFVQQQHQFVQQQMPQQMNNMGGMGQQQPKPPPPPQYSDYEQPPPQPIAHAISMEQLSYTSSSNPTVPGWDDEVANAG
jgi:hypothetical protein